jgi:transcriptional regulator with XRE-family HTH domain
VNNFKGPLEMAKRGEEFADIDRHVGQRLRERRILLGLTQLDLAKRIGVTYQQQHKYESGVNRLTAGRLFALAKALQVPLQYFFDEVDGGVVVKPPTVRERLSLSVARDMQHLTSAQQESLLAVIRSMRAPAP